MLAKKISTTSELVPTYARRGFRRPVPRHVMPETSMEPGDAYRLIHDELSLDGNPALNLATFVSTWMEEEADRLILESLNKNAIDWDEYPQTVQLEDRCVSILAHLFHAPDTAVGTATVGSSEAIHLAGLAMKWRWRKTHPTGQPNIVMGANVQVCWEKFARYFDVEPRYVPLSDSRFVIGPDEARALVDENTIGVVGILGSTYTGEYEPIAALDAALEGTDVPIHIDAASGGFVAPFIQPELAWDFRIPRVCSINVSGHKYGLVYPGIGWAIWRDALPEELIFKVDYLGGSHDDFGLNFSRGASQIVAQYYNFLRLGFKGYRDIMTSLQETAKWIAGELEGTGTFELLGKGDDLPVVCCRMNDGDVFALSDTLRRRGWVVPAYKMAPKADDVAVLRIVVREGLSLDMAAELVKDIRADVKPVQGVSKGVC